MDDRLRELERTAKQTKSDTDIISWLKALITYRRPMPILTTGWYKNARIYKTAKGWRTSDCKHAHPNRHNARACVKRKVYQQRKSETERCVNAGILPENYSSRLRLFSRLANWLNV